MPMLVSVFDRPQDVVAAVTKLKGRGFDQIETYSPAPFEEIDDAVDPKPSAVRAFTLIGGLAGVGGVILASQLRSGSPTYAPMYELYVIAAVVVGGTSLAGGEGKVLGTLIGALIIAVIQNGMNLTGVESYTQNVVLGVVLLLAVLLDQAKRKFTRGGV